MDFKLFSTRIYISYYFCALVCLVLLTDKSGMSLPSFTAVLFHELSHLAVMMIYRCMPSDIIVSPGGFTIRGRELVSYIIQFKISVIGPIVNIIGSVIFYLYYIFLKDSVAIVWSGIWLILGLVNMLPSAGLDGGTALYSLVSHKYNARTAKIVLKITSIISALIFIVLTYFAFKASGFNISFVIFAIYLFMACLFKI